jgi:hypothetical protein
VASAGTRPLMCAAEITGDQMTLRVLLSHIRFLVCPMYIPGNHSSCSVEPSVRFCPGTASVCDSLSQKARPCPGGPRPDDAVCIYLSGPLTEHRKTSQWCRVCFPLLNWRCLVFISFHSCTSSGLDCWSLHHPECISTSVIRPIPIELPGHN